MEQTNFSVGLDIGTTKIVALVGRKNEFNKVEILGVGKSKSLGVHRGVVNNITQTIQSIQQAVDDANTNSGNRINDVVVGIAGQHIRSIQHSDYITRENPESVINEDDIQRLIKQVYKLVMLPGEEIIHVLPQEYKVDGQGEIKEPIGMHGGRLEANFHVVVGQVSSIKNIGRCIKSAGLNMANITLEPLASSEAVLSFEEKEAGVALIDIGGGTTDLAIFKDGIIRHTAVIPFGGNVITDDITEKAYNSFMVNRSLSYFNDTVVLANEMNRYHHLDNKLQFDFLINMVRKRKRFSKWIKPQIESDIEVVKEYYGYSNEKARQVLPLLSPEQINGLKKKVNKGGRNNNS